MENRLWSGRFKDPTNKELEKLNSSLKLDKRMYSEDVEGSKAYAKSLCNINLITQKEYEIICEGLELIKVEWEKGTFVIKNGDEDIHMANERRLKEIVGDAGAKLHTGRSRNDQVVTDMKLWLRANLKHLDDYIKNLIKVIVERSDDEIDIVMPGYTHLQKAQPVRWSHYLLSHGWNLKKDCDRLQEIMSIVNVMPLGSGAIAGNPFPIDRMDLAKSLGFDGITQNSMQAVGDRDFIAEFLFWASMVGIHLSRLAEDLIIYSSEEFEFIKIHDSYSTGSSLMPQKRNPDSLELIRGIGGSLFGQCCSFIMVLKSLPSTYNKDLQNDKETMFTTYDKLKSILEVATGTVKTLKINQDKCRGALNFEMLATDLAYYLVRKGVPFRESHRIASEVVKVAEEKSVSISDLTLEELREISPEFNVDVGKVWNFENSIEQYKATGGTAKSNVKEQIKKLHEWLLIPS